MLVMGNDSEAAGCAVFFVVLGAFALMWVACELVDVGAIVRGSRVLSYIAYGK